MKKHAWLVALIVLGGGAASAEALPKMISSSGDWGVYAYQRGGKTVCYALSVPKDSQPSNVDHGKNYFLIAPAEGLDRKEPEVIAGYPLRPGSMIEVSVGPSTFRMFTRDNTGWVNDTSRAPELMKVLRAGHTMVLRAVSARGTRTTYSYSLEGISAALDSVSHCK